jgi:hypothetical protein
MVFFDCRKLLSRMSDVTEQQINKRFNYIVIDMLHCRDRGGLLLNPRMCAYLAPRPPHHCHRILF